MTYVPVTDLELLYTYNCSCGGDGSMNERIHNYCGRTISAGHMEVLVSSGPLTCPVIWGTWGIVPGELIPSSVNAFDLYGAGAGQRTHGPESHSFNMGLHESL